MPDRTLYEQGTPNWVDLQTTDQSGAKAFYGQLFGWEFDDQPMPDGQVYSMALKRSGSVAAIAPQSPELAAHNAPTMWNTYIAVDDVDAATARADSSGGKVLMPAFDVVGAGRMSFVADPSGAAVALWQARDHVGATVVNEPGAVVWNELVTDDVPAAVRFFEAVLGIGSEVQDMGIGAYTMFTVAGRAVCGATPPQSAETPNHWHVYFQVEDVPATAAKAAALGGTALGAPIDTPVGPMVTLKDPQGGTFTVMAPPASDDRTT